MTAQAGVRMLIGGAEAGEFSHASYRQHIPIAVSLSNCAPIPLSVHTTLGPSRTSNPRCDLAGIIAQAQPAN
jgi:hypothetical protein